MSWYNNTDNSFIDATQTFEGGSGGTITEGDGNGTGAGSQLSDVLELKLDYYQNEYEEPQPTLVYNLYLKNNNVGGEIRFLTKDAENNNDVSNNSLKYNCKIGTDGKLYLYYTYNPLISALITSGWTDVVDYIVGSRQATINNAGALATTTTLLQAEISALETALNSTNALVGTNIVNIGDHEERIQAVEVRTVLRDIDEEDDALASYLSNFRDTLSERTADLFDDLVAQAQGSGIINSIQVLRATRGQLAFNLFQAITGGGVIAGFIGLGYYLLDFYKDQMVERDIANIVKTLEYGQQDPDKTVVDRIYLGGLQINQTTNTNFITAGIYEDIDAGNGAKLTIEITSALLAVINSVSDNGTGGFTVGDVISIPKTQIGGTTGNLEINVLTVASVVQLLEEEFIEAQGELEEINNRKRRRRFIPNKDEFGDGLNVSQTFTTEPTGEQLSQLDISLKLDTSQFQYDATGNLQIQNYGTIPVNPSQFQYVGGNLELINYNQIGQNATDISSIQSSITTMINDINTNAIGISQNAGNIITNTANITTNATNIATNTADIATNAGDITLLNTSLGITNGNVLTNANDISSLQTDIANLNSDKTEIYQLILNDGETPSTTTTHTVNIGFNKSEFNNIIFNLIMGAVKLTSTQEIAFNITDFRGYYFGTYPDMTRLNYNDTITLVKQDNSYYYNDTNWNSGGLVQRGAYYFKNEQTGFVYDLNKRFEYLGFHRFKINISGQNTYVIRTGLEFEEIVGIPSYQPDPDKLQFYLRDGKFYFSHLCRYDLTYYAIRFNQNILSDFINPVATFSSIISPTGNNRATLNLNITTAPFNEDYYLRIDDSLEGITRTEMENLFDTTTTHSNERFCGMVQNFTGQVNPAHVEFGSIVLFQSQYTTNYRIARIELEYQFKIRDTTNSFWIVSNPQTQSVLNQVVEELVFDFFNSYQDTIPADTVPLNNRQIFSTSTNTIAIDFDKSPDTQYYLYEKWRIRARFISGVSGYANQGNLGYGYVPNQRSAFIKKVKLFPYVQKTISRELVEEFTDGTTHSLSAFDYNKINLHVNLNNHISPYNDIWYKLNDNLDANKFQITIPASFNTTNFTGITDLPPNVTSLPTDNFDFLNDDFFISSAQTSITELNDILIIGEEDIAITQYETHFGWRFLQPTDNNMSETNLDDYDYLKTYNYYHRTAICDRFFSCKEFYADIIDFKNLLVDGNLAYDDMTTNEFSTLSQNSDGFTLKSLSSVNIQNLYGLTGTGFLYYDSVNGFTVQTANVTNYWTQVNAVEISYPYTISVDRVNTTTIVLTAGSPSASITFADGSSITTATGLSYSTYTDADVKNVLALSGGNNISWNVTTEQFDLDSQVTTDISNNSTAITNLNNLIEDVSGDTKVKATNDIIFENNSIEKFRITQAGNIKTGTSSVTLPIDFSHIPDGWVRVNQYGHIKMRNTQTSSRWDISIRSTGLLSFSTVTSGTFDNGVMNSVNNVMVLTSGGFVGIGTNTPGAKLDVTGYVDCFGVNFTTNINNVLASEFNYLSGVTSSIQTQLNNLDGRITGNQLAIAVHSTDIININNDISTLTTRSLQNEADIATLTTSVNSLTYLPSILYNSGSITYLDTTNNNDFKLRLGTTDALTINKSSLNVPTLNTPNALIVNTSASTANVYGLEMQSRGILLKTSGSFVMDNTLGVIVRGATTSTGTSIFDMNDGNSFFRLNPLCMMLFRNQNNANRYQIGIRNNGELCIGNDTSTNSGTMGGANDKLKVKPGGEVEVRYNLKVGGANGALLTEISLLNLPTSQPSTANLIWRDSQGYLRIS